MLRALFVTFTQWGINCSESLTLYSLKIETCKRLLISRAAWLISENEKFLKKKALKASLKIKMCLLKMINWRLFQLVKLWLVLLHSQFRWFISKCSRKFQRCKFTYVCMYVCNINEVAIYLWKPWTYSCKVSDVLIRKFMPVYIFN